MARFLSRMTSRRGRPSAALESDHSAQGSALLRALLAGDDLIARLLAPVDSDGYTPADGDEYAKRCVQALSAGPLSERLAAGVMYGMRRAESLEGVLVLLLGNPGSDTCMAAAVALGFRGDARSVPHLLPMLSHHCFDVRLAAAGALGMLGQAGHAALASLEEMRRRDPDRDVREAAGRSVWQIRQALRRGPTELEAAEAPTGRGTEPEAADAPAGRGTELLRDGN